MAIDKEKVIAELQDEINILLNSAHDNNACVLGFIWGADPPILMQFSNVKESTPEEIHCLVDDLMILIERKRAAGNVKRTTMGKIYRA
jgi:hypothetical protein